jgi:hypothetical protein
MEIKKCLQQIYDIFNDFNSFFISYPLRNYTNTNNINYTDSNYQSIQNPNSNSFSYSSNDKSELNKDYLNKQTLKIYMLKYIQNLKEIDKNFPKNSNDNILISKFLDVMFDEVN